MNNEELCKAITEAHAKPECIKQGEFKEGELCQLN